MSLPFLDLIVSISCDTFSTDIYYKHTDSQSYLNYISHPVLCKDALYFSQLLCLCCICSQVEAFHSWTSEKSFRKGGFPCCSWRSPHISPFPTCLLLSRPLWFNHPNLIEIKVPLVLTFHPTSLHNIFFPLGQLQWDPISSSPPHPFMLSTGTTLWFPGIFPWNVSLVPTPFPHYHPMAYLTLPGEAAMHVYLLQHHLLHSALDVAWSTLARPVWPISKAPKHCPQAPLWTYDR